MHVCSHPPVILVDAAYRFYRSKCEEDTIKRKGQLDAKKKTKRKHERRVRVRSKEYRDIHV